MAYGIMNHNLEYERAEDYLNALSTSKAEEQDFVNVQNIWLDYITDVGNFVLSSSDSLVLRTAGEAYNVYGGYSRTLFYVLTGERITRAFTHLDGSVTQRSSAYQATDIEIVKSVSVEVFPNPTDEGIIKVFIDGLEEDKQCEILVFDAMGKLISSDISSQKRRDVLLDESKGFYFISLRIDGHIVYVSRVVRL